MTFQSSNWQEKTTVKKGDIGEAIVNEYLISKGFIPYAPNADGAHPFDRLVASRDKKTIFIADAKTKAARKYYPDTGINIKHYNEYKFISGKYGIDVFIFFVDEEAKKVYGNYLRVLEAENAVTHNGKTLKYPLIQGEVIYFPLCAMVQIAKIEDAQANALQGFTTKNEQYKSK